MSRLKIGSRGEIQLSEKLLHAIHVAIGDELTVAIEGDKIVLGKYKPVDPFAVPLKKPDPDALDQAFELQKKRQEQAKKDFTEKMSKPVDVRPEDHPDYWR